MFSYLDLSGGVTDLSASLGCGSGLAWPPTEAKLVGDTGSGGLVTKFLCLSCFCGGILLRLAALLLLIFFSTILSSSSVNCPSLKSSWQLIIFIRGLSVMFGEFPSRYLECSFHIHILSSWLVAFSFALEVCFLWFPSFSVCHVIRNYLSSTKFLILLIWPWIYSFCYVLVLFGLS